MYPYFYPLRVGVKHNLWSYSNIFPKFIALSQRRAWAGPQWEPGAGARAAIRITDCCDERRLQLQVVLDSRVA